MTVRHPSDQPETASATPAPARHVGGRAGLVEKHQPPRIKPWLEVFPHQPRRRHVGALRLGGVHGFFKADAVPLEEPPDRAHANPHTRSPSSPRVSSGVRSPRRQSAPIASRCAAVSGCGPSATWPRHSRCAATDHPGGRRRLADAQPAPRPARRKTALNCANDPDAQIAGICSHHAVPQQHLWAHSRSIHHIWKSQHPEIYPTGNR